MCVRGDGVVCLDKTERRISNQISDFVWWVTHAHRTLACHLDSRINNLFPWIMIYFMQGGETFIKVLQAAVLSCRVFVVLCSSTYGSSQVRWGAGQVRQGAGLSQV